VAESINMAGKSALWITIALRMVFSKVMQDILGALNFMQLVIYVPLINIKFPATALILYGEIISIVSFDLLPSDDLYPGWFNLPET
jgi:hypothetical protein